MHTRSVCLGIAFVLTALAGLVACGTAWPQAGSVLSEQKISDTQGNFTAVLDDVDEFGGAAASLGDLDGLGPSVVAVAVGAIGDDDGGGDRGAVYVLFLDGAGSVLSHQKISDAVNLPGSPLGNNDEFGASVVHLGDLDGPGASVAALAVGATLDDDGGTNSGALYVLFLSSSATVLSTQKITNAAVPGSPLDNGDEFGASLAYLGDLDGPGPSVAALAVGADGDDDGGTNQGALYVLFLSSSASVLSVQKISETEGNFTGSPLDPVDEFGGALGHLGDLDGPGGSVAALAVGAPFDDDGGADRGAVYVLFLNGSGSVVSYQKISSTQGNLAAPLLDADEFGGAVVDHGDVDGPGLSVLAMAVGAIGDDDGGSGRGAVYVVFLSSAGTVLSHQKISDTQGNLQGALDDLDEFGSTVAAVGDLDGPGPAAQTLVSGASFDDDGGSDRGAVYVLYLEGVSTAAVGDPPGAEFALGRVTPNPARNGVQIDYMVPHEARARLSVFDVAGREVTLLEDGVHPPGRHRGSWNGLIDGREAPAGVYFMGVRTAHGTRVRRFVLTR